MSAGGFSPRDGLAGGLVTGLAVFLVGLAVKAVDDLLDEPERYARDTAGQAAYAGVIPYVALALAAAAGLAPSAAVSLFLAAYAIGMAPSPFIRLPSGLPSWAESVVGVGLGVLLTGPVETLGSLLLVAGAQALDDLLDLAIDRAAGTANIALALGRWPTLALGALLWAAASALSPAKALSGLAVLTLIVAAPAAARLRSSRSEARPAESPSAPGSRSQIGRTGLPLTAGGAAAAGLLGLAGAAIGPGLLTSKSGLGRGIPVTSASPGAQGVAGAGIAGWALLLVGFVACAAVTGGLALAYRRGLEAGRRKGSAAERALGALRERATALDGADGAGPGTPLRRGRGRDTG